MKAVFRRYTRLSSLQIGTLIVVGIVLLAATAVLQGDLEFLERNAILVTTDPLQTPLVLSVGMISLFLGLSAVIGVTSEVENGTLAVLLSGPVTTSSFLAGIVLGSLVFYSWSLLLVLGWSVLAATIINLHISAALLLMMAASYAVVFAVISLGLLISAWSQKRWTAILVYAAIVLLDIALRVLDRFIGSVPVQSESTRNDPWHFLRSVSGVLDRAVQWFSPFAKFDAMARALEFADYQQFFLQLMGTILFGVVMFFLASWLLKGQRA
ncbi:MAG: ABC transporter permease subunit [Thermomicrobiales bacterium]|nr:ABC transporter permease subunit [Thermomicrobiales bacterium]